MAFTLPSTTYRKYRNIDQTIYKCYGAITTTILPPCVCQYWQRCFLYDRCGCTNVYFRCVRLGGNGTAAELTLLYESMRKFLYSHEQNILVIFVRQVSLMKVSLLVCLSNFCSYSVSSTSPQLTSGLPYIRQVLLNC